MEASWRDIANGAALLSVDGNGLPEQPLVLIDLDAHGPAPRDLQPPDGPTAVVVGVTAADPAPSTSAQLSCWASPDEIRDIEKTVSLAPVAAVTLCSLVQDPHLDQVRALVAESLAYSTLLAGSEFRQWLDASVSTAAPTDTDPVLVERIDDELVITLNRPGRHNAYSAAMRDGLRAALDVARADPLVRVVLRGAGPSFCSGGDLAEFGTSTDPAAAHLVRISTGAARSLSLLSDRTRAVLHGACVGAGIELVAFARRVEAAEGTWFQLPELGMGLVPGAGGTVSLPGRIGRWRTTQLALTRRKIDVDTALAWGLVDARTA